MRTESITEETIAENRKLAQLEPATGLPTLARCLLQFGRQIDRERHAQRLPYFEEAAAIYRGLVARGADEHLNAAAHAISSLGLQYSAAHADDLALAARHEAAALARRLNLQRGDSKKEIKILMDLAHGLAEAGQFAQAVTVRREVVDIYRATGSPGSYPLPANVMWSLLDLAIYLDLAGQINMSMEIEQEALALQHRLAEADPGRLPALAIWASGFSLRFTDMGHPQQARGLLQDAIAACDLLPAEGTQGNFGFHQAIHAALFARSGARDEGLEASRPIPIGVNPDQALQPVLGTSFHHWAFSVRQTYRAGLDAICAAITASAEPLPQDPVLLAELGTLMRRRSIRESVLCWGPRHFLEKITPDLAHSVNLEHRLLAVDPGQGTRRLTRALTDQAMAYLVAGANASAGNALREAHEWQR